MTQTYSQKRFRHNNNTAPRFRDQPPRFKRQKSSTDPEESNFEKKENIALVSPKFYTEESYQGNIMKNPLKEQVMRASPVNSVPPLSVAVDTDNYHNSQQINAFGYRDLAVYPQSYVTPPFSPISTASCGSVRDLSGYRPPPVSPVAFSSPYVSPGLEMANAKVNSTSTTHHNHGNKVVYSDPDKQTILLLRELERVADEKEKEDQEKEKDVCNGNGTDRKNLVSHHLRMLMCAVDRYTADVDETSSSDGCVSEASASPAPSTVSSPCPTPTPKSLTPQPSQWQMNRVQQQSARNSPIHIRENDLFTQQVRNQATKNHVVSNMPLYSKLVPPPAIPFYSTHPPPVITQQSFPIPPPFHEQTQAHYQKKYDPHLNSAPVNCYNHQMPFFNQKESNRQPTPLDNLAHLIPPENLEEKPYTAPMEQDKDWNLWSGPSFFSMPFEQYKR